MTDGGCACGKQPPRPGRRARAVARGLICVGVVVFVTALALLIDPGGALPTVSDTRIGLVFAALGVGAWMISGGLRMQERRRR